MMSNASAPVLVLHQDSELRHSVSRDLTRAGFECVPAISAAEAEMYFSVLRPQLVVAPFAELGQGTHFIDQLLTGSLRPNSRTTTLAIIGERAEQERLLPREVVFVAGAALSARQLTDKILLLLLGKKLALASDHAVEALVGSLDQRPFLELLRDLTDSGEPCHVTVEGFGDCRCAGGEVIAATAGSLVGEKAFCRLARHQEGAFQIRRLETQGLETQGQVTIRTPWDELMIRAINESLIPLPPLDARLSVEVDEAFFDRQLSELEQQVLHLAQVGCSVQEALNLPTASDAELAEALQALVNKGILSLVPPRPPLRVVTDSTADLPTALSERLGLVTVPLTVAFGKRVFRDRIEIQPKSFYELLTNDKHHPHSNPPTVELLEETYKTLCAESDVLAIHLSSELSKTINHAQEAARKLDDAGSEHGLKVLDSRQVSLGLGLVALLATRLAPHCEDLDSLAEQVETLISETKTLFAVDTLTFLERGGRINKARAWLGTLLKVKPILGLEDGQVVPFDRVRGGRAAYPRLVDLLKQRFDPKRPIFAAVAHGNAPQWADRLRGLIEQNFECREILLAEIGPVVGTHTGPGTVGVSVYQPPPELLDKLSS